MSGGQQRFDFLAGGGEMGALTRTYDWDNSPLGPPENWPQSLRAMLRMMLNTRHPMFIWWGPELIQFYNDAYRETMGYERGPSALGRRGRECWAEIWDIVGPQIEHVMAGKGSTWHQDHLVPVTRNGRREDAWWTYSYGPIDVEDGVGGVLVVCQDVTEQHLSREALNEEMRRLHLLYEQAPGFMAVLRGPDQVFEVTNAAFRRIGGDRDYIGRSVREAFPELEGQGLFELLNEVYQTGEAFVAERMPLRLQAEAGSASKKMMLDFVYQPIVAANGKVSGIFVEGMDVTDNVDAEEHLRLLNEELKHRVKNTLAMVSAIAGQTFRGSGKDVALAAFHGRLIALGKAQDTLTATNRATASLHAVVEGALEPHRTGDRRISVSGPELVIGSRQALSLALAIHELATNAAKYGALSGDRGRVDISWQEERTGETSFFLFSWQERDGPIVVEPTKRGFGSQLIERVLTADFGGRIEVVYDPTGLICRLNAPMDNLR